MRFAGFAFGRRPRPAPGGSHQLRLVNLVLTSGGRIVGARGVLRDVERAVAVVARVAQRAALCPAQVGHDPTQHKENADGPVYRIGRPRAKLHVRGDECGMQGLREQVVETNGEALQNFTRSATMKRF